MSEIDFESINFITHPHFESLLMLEGQLW